MKTESFGSALSNGGRADRLHAALGHIGSNPRSASPRAETPVAAPASVSAFRGAAEVGFRILLVEDDTAVRDLVAKFLKREGYEVTEACSVSEALDYLRHGEFSGYIVDHRLADGDCLEILSFLHERADQKPTLVITGLATQDMVVALNTFGVRDVLVKPFQMGQLREAARNHFPVKKESLLGKTIELPVPGLSPRVGATRPASGEEGLAFGVRFFLAFLLLAAAGAVTFFLFS